ncbi:PKD domain-containing protein [Pseudomonadota bacterium]
MKYHRPNRLKFLLASFAILLTLTFVSNSAIAQSCSSNCLRVYSIDLTDLGSSIRGIVKLTDETGAGAGARGSVVHAVWTRPDGSSFDQYANIGTRLRAQFSLYTAGVAGTYTLTVAGATKAGYKFDPKKSALLSKSITVNGTGNLPPTAVSNADTLSGSAPLTVAFDSTGSNDPDGNIVAWSWDFGDGNGSAEASPLHTYLDIGNYSSVLTVTDDMGATGSSSVSITVSDSNAGCTSQCMSVDRISMSYKKKTNDIKTIVWIVDENGSAVKNAGIHAVWTLPDGFSQSDYADSGARARGVFTLPAAMPGLYTLTVVELVDDGYTFDPSSSNMLSGMINISP